jgi:hypothetical protein
MIREALKFAAVGGPVTLAAYPTFAFTDPMDCDGFLQICFELYPASMVGDLYYTLQFCDDEQQPASAAGWLADPIEGTTTDVGTDTQVPVKRAVRRWPASTPVQINSPLPHRWVRIGVAAGTSGSCMVIGKRVRLASQ